MRASGRAQLLAKAAVLAALLALSGCERGFFSAHGFVGSAGGTRINTWRSVPQGCTRDPFDGLPVGQSKSILTLLWENPGVRDPGVANVDTAPDAPLRLQFAHAPEGTGSPVAATLETIRQAGIPLDPRVCTTFRLNTREQPPVVSTGRPTLSGDVALDCRVKTGHITANVHFQRCSY